MSVVGARLVAALPRATEPLWLISGQSNALGAGVAVKNPLEIPWRAYAGLDPNTWPADLDIVQWKYLCTRSGNHHGPEFGIATAAIAAGRQPTIVKCAVNGSGLGPVDSVSWGKSANELYPVLLATAIEAQTLAGRKLDVFCWNQGERDANDEPLSLDYLTNLTQFFNDIRTDLDAPNMRVVIVRMRLDSGVAFPENVRAAQTTYVSNDPLAALVNVDDLILQDTVHLDSASQDTCGTRAWAAYSLIS